jgi:hypothetical protein
MRKRELLMRLLDHRGVLVGVAAAGVVSLMIVVGSQNLRHFDLALLPYALATIFAAFAVAYRYAVWLRRPPTWRYWVQGWRLFWRSPIRNTLHLGRLLLDHFAAQRFDGKRSLLRWTTHFCLSWGCMIAFAITFPLVFGWVYVETLPDDPMIYRLFFFGFPVQQFPVHSVLEFLVFNTLNLSAILVLIGIALAIQQRMREPGEIAVQQFGNDLVPLLILFMVAATGLMLTVSARWLKGHGYPFIALTHAATVIALLLYLPFGKFFHIFQRTAQLGVALYKEAARIGPQAYCIRCREPYASAMHVEDLKQVLGELDMDYRLDGPVPHYQEICPACRRKLLALNQGKGLGR